ncbi:hypothetical protein E2C01_026431 [Portunus trituberculatus]|uniref:Uncharacterized protein n=1 Tax=Portunus trituberculatus TaxID=210409 RepID=A0A5B7EIU8_PORTR|nr:hypothetical protein [Portunus trituberculatus]
MGSQLSEMAGSDLEPPPLETLWKDPLMWLTDKGMEAHGQNPQGKQPRNPNPHYPHLSPTLTLRSPLAPEPSGILMNNPHDPSKPFPCPPATPRSPAQLVNTVV